MVLAKRPKKQKNIQQCLVVLLVREYLLTKFSLKLKIEIIIVSDIKLIRTDTTL